MSETYADQRGHDVTWMTAAERASYDKRLEATEARIREHGGKPCTMSVDERGGVTVTWWWQR